MGERIRPQLMLTLRCQCHGVNVMVVCCVLVQVCQLVEQQGGTPTGHDLGPLLHLYKALLALACNNHKAAKKEVGACTSYVCC